MNPREVPESRYPTRPIKLTDGFLSDGTSTGEYRAYHGMAAGGVSVRTNGMVVGTNLSLTRACVATCPGAWNLETAEGGNSNGVRGEPKKHEGWFLKTTTQQLLFDCGVAARQVVRGRYVQLRAPIDRAS